MSRKGETDRMTAGRAAAGIILLIGIILMVTSYVMGMLWPFGVVMGMLFIAIALMFLVSWHSQVTAYECAKCGHVFEVSKTEDLRAPHGVGEGGGWKLLKCPECGKKSRAKVHLK
jgi:DNA-directed RNA polymerase subunit RPC12/RpoP